MIKKLLRIHAKSLSDALAPSKKKLAMVGLEAHDTIYMQVLTL